MVDKEFLVDMAMAGGVEVDNATVDKQTVIPEPHFKVTSEGHYSFTWAGTDRIQILVRGLRGNTGDLTGVMSVQWQDREILTPTNMRFRSINNRTLIDRQLKKHLKIDWGSRLISVQLICEKHYTAGDPAAWLDERDMPGPIQFHMAPLLEYKEHTMIYGDGDSGKSTLALAVALSVADGVDLIPGLSNEKTTSRVLYLDWETNDATHIRRMHALLAGKNIPKRHLLYKRMYTPFAEAVDEIASLVNTNGIGLIVVDSVSMASGGLISDEQAVAQFFLATRAVGCTTLSIAHVAKENISRKPLGSTFWWNQCRAAFEIIHDQAEGENQYFVSLNHRKHNNQARQNSLAFRVEFDENSITYHVTDPATNAKLNEFLSLPKRIEAYLLNEPWKSAAEIGEVLDKRPPKVHDALTRGMDARPQRFVRRGPKGRYEWAVAFPVGNPTGNPTNTTNISTPKRVSFPSLETGKLTQEKSTKTKSKSKNGTGNLDSLRLEEAAEALDW